eukprot:gene23881-biopygen5868
MHGKKGMHGKRDARQKGCTARRGCTAKGMHVKRDAWQEGDARLSCFLETCIPFPGAAQAGRGGRPETPDPGLNVQNDVQWPVHNPQQLPEGDEEAIRVSRHRRGDRHRRVAWRT